MEQLIDSFRFNSFEIIILGSIGFLFAIEVFFYLFFYNRPYSVYKKTIEENNRSFSDKLPSVSVIIIATDEYVNLEQNLPLILNQKYPDYEVIVVNNGLTDDTDTLLKGLKLQYPHLYHTFLPKHSDEEAIRRKLAYTIGIKAAKKDILLFTGADTFPLSSKWITAIMSQMKNGKDVVLGYCSYEKSTGFVNRIARYDNLLYSIQNLSAALLNKPIMGIYRNIAYRKELFFNNKGFSSVLNYAHCETLFLNTIMTRNNTTVCLDPEGFVTTRLKTFTKWKQIKIYLNKVKKNIRNFRFLPKAFTLEAICRILFYFSCVAAITFSVITQSWVMLGIIILLLIARVVSGILILNKQSVYLKAGKFYFSYIVMDILQPIYNLYFRAKS